MNRSRSTSWDIVVDPVQIVSKNGRKVSDDEYERRDAGRPRSPTPTSYSATRQRRESDSRLRRRDAAPETKCLGVFGLNGITKEDTIHGVFSRYGRIRRINIVFDTKTGRSRGFCFIYFKHLRDAIEAKEACSGMEIDYRRIRVDYSTTQRPHEPTPGVYKGNSLRRSTHERSDRHRYRSRSRSPQRDRHRRSRYP